MQVSSWTVKKSKSNLILLWSIELDERRWSSKKLRQFIIYKLNSDPFNPMTVSQISKEGENFMKIQYLRSKFTSFRILKLKMFICIKGSCRLHDTPPSNAVFWFDLIPIHIRLSLNSCAHTQFTNLKSESVRFEWECRRVNDSNSATNW